MPGRNSNMSAHDERNDAAEDVIKCLGEAASGANCVQNSFEDSEQFGASDEWNKLFNDITALMKRARVLAR